MRSHLLVAVGCLGLLSGCTSESVGRPDAASALVVSATTPIDFMSAGVIGTIGFDADGCVLVKADANSATGEIVVWPRAATVDQAAGRLRLAPGNVVEVGKLYLFGGGMISADSAIIASDLGPTAAACLRKAGTSIYFVEEADLCTRALCPDVTLPES